MHRCTLGLLVALLATLVAVPLAPEAQPTAKVWRIGWLRQGDPPPGIRDALLQGLRDMGYIEGQHFVIETRSGQGHVEPLAAFAAELVRLPVDVLVTNGIAATLAGRAATSTLPIVFVYVPDPVEQGIIATWAHPGGNLTGVASGGTALTAKGAQLFQEVVPAATRVAVLANPDNPGYQVGTSLLRDPLRLLKIDVYHMEVRDPATELEQAFAALAHERVDALAIGGDTSFVPYRARIVELVATTRLPAIYPYASYVEAGGLMSYEPDNLAMNRRAGMLVGHILHGTPPAGLPAEYPAKFVLTVNLKTAKALGITLPPHLLVLADKVIQ
jgi:putative ABC transport system substrate-binding protein